MRIFTSVITTKTNIMTTQITLDSLISDLLDRRLMGVTAKNVKRHLEGMTENTEFVNKVCEIVELRYNEMSVKDVSDYAQNTKVKMY